MTVAGRPATCREHEASHPVPPAVLQRITPERATVAIKMIHGMTGFGRSAREEPALRIAVELRTVNHRYAEVSLRLPHYLNYLEARLRRRVATRLGRGRAEVSIHIDRVAGEPCRLTLNRAVVEGLLEVQETLRSQYGLPGELDVASLARFPDALSTRPAAESLAEAEVSALESALDEAVEAVVSMRQEEGRMISCDIEARLETVAGLRADIEQRAGAAPEVLSRRLQERLADLLPEGRTVDPDRLAQEVALLAERIDVTEELVRLGGYLDQVRTIVQGDGEGAGKRLEFTLQEMNRETNTIGSKISDSAIGERVIAIKLELERMREQVHNVA